MPDSRSDAQVEADCDDREFLLRPHAWPGQFPPRLYVKRRRGLGQGPETGPLVLWGADPDEYVIAAHHWDGRELLPTPHAAETAVVNETVTNLRYTSVDDLLADGWVVD